MYTSMGQSCYKIIHIFLIRKMSVRLRNMKRNGYNRSFLPRKKPVRFQIIFFKKNTSSFSVLKYNFFQTPTLNCRSVTYTKVNFLEYRSKLFLWGKVKNRKKKDSSKVQGWIMLQELEQWLKKLLILTLRTACDINKGARVQ